MLNLISFECSTHQITNYEKIIISQFYWKKYFIFIFCDLANSAYLANSATRHSASLGTIMTDRGYYETGNAYFTSSLLAVSPGLDRLTAPYIKYENDRFRISCSGW